MKPGQTIDYTYDDAGRMLTRTITDTQTQSAPFTTSGNTRTTTWTYNALGLVATIDGPRTDVADVTTYAYDANGDLQSTTNALGQVTEIVSRDARGLPTRVRDANGTETALAYDARSRLITRTVESSQGNAVTAFAYDGVGQLTAVTLPAGETLAYEYDDAQRLTAIENGLGERIEYTLDAAGNRLAETVKDPSGNVRRVHQRLFDELSRLIQDLGASGQSVDYGYDDVGNLTSSVDGEGNVTTQAFDALNRLTTVTDALAHDATYVYDARDNLIQVTDPLGVVTSYVYDGLDNLIQETSTASGVTVFRHDAAGNVIERTDARGQVSTTSYDALNRPVATLYAGAPDENTVWNYDDTASGNAGIGRLTGVTDASGTTAMRYDDRGNVVAETRVIDGASFVTAYAFNLSDNLVSMTYPSGGILDYERDAIGRVIRVTTREDVAATPEVVAENITWLPFGPADGWTHGNGIVTTRSFDQDYRITRILAGSVMDRLYSYDDADNVTAIADGVDPARNQTFGYDPLLRLTSASGVYGGLGYGYDAVGNRTSSTIDDGNLTTEIYSYQPGSHRLVALLADDGAAVTQRDLTYTATGATATDNGPSARQFQWNARDRLSAATVDGTTTAYTYNALGQRVRKLGADDIRFHYDREGRLLAETATDGSVLREYVWADGMRLGLIAPTPAVPDDLHLDVAATTTQGAWLASTAAGGHVGEHYLYAPPVAAVPGLGDEADVQTPGLPPSQPADPSSADVLLHLKLDDSSGQVAVDASGQGLDGVLLGGFDFDTAAVAGIRDAALSFDGVGNAIDVGPVDLGHLSALTVAAWVRTTTTSGHQRVISKDRVGTPGNFILRWQSQWGAWLFQVYDSADGTWRNARFDGGSLHDGAWHHLAGTVDAAAGTATLWVNGVAVDTQPFTAATLDDSDGERLMIGADANPAALAETFQGRLDDVRVYGRALLPAEIADLAWQAPPLPPGFSAGLALHMPLDESSGTVATDATGHGFDGTLEGSDFALSSIPGRTGGALAFDGLGTRLDLGAMDMAGWDGLTVAAWLQTTSTARMRLFAKDRLGTPGNFVLRYHDSWNAWVFSAFDAALGDWRHATWPGQAINDGAWHHVAGVVDTRASVIRLVVNGETVAEAPFTSTTLDDSDGERLVLGADSHPNAPGDWFDGAIDEVRVYHRALAPSELRQLAGKPAGGYAGRVIAHLPLDESSGTTAADASLFGHEGTLFGNFDFTSASIPGRRGQALDFDGSGDRIDLGPLDFTGLGALTVSAWIRPTDPTLDQRVIAKDRVGTPGAFILRYVAATASWQWQVFDASSGVWRIATTTANLFGGDWHLLTGVLDAASGTIRLYVDGVLAATTQFSADALDDSDREHVVIGGDSHPTTPDRFFAGALDDVRLYALALTDAQAQSLYTSPTAAPDLDGDGVPDAQDAFPLDASEWQDSDGDGVGDNADPFSEDATASSALTWTFAVAQAGEYALWANVPGGHNRTAAARYWVTHAGGGEVITIDQRLQSGEVYLGTWTFDAGVDYTVTLANAADGYAVADQMSVRYEGESPPSESGELQLAYLHEDHLGTPQVITGSSGTVLWQADYRPFGQADVTTNLIDNDLRFPGQLFDGESGLHYNYFRDYDSSLGRYVQSDPIGLAGGHNSFGYAFQNPLSFWDPNGLSPLGTLNSMAWFRWSLSRDMGAPPEVYIPQKANEFDEQTCELQCLLPIPEVDIVLAAEISAVTAVAASTSEIAKVLAKEVGKRAVLALSVFTIAECLSKCRQGGESCSIP